MRDCFKTFQSSHFIDRAVVLAQYLSSGPLLNSFRFETVANAETGVFDYTPLVMLFSRKNMIKAIRLAGVLCHSHPPSGC